MLLCHCHRVNEARVTSVLAAGADGIRGVVRATKAGSGCGGCLPLLREICAQASRHCDAHHDEALAG